MRTPSLLVATLFLVLPTLALAADGSSYPFIKTNSGKVYTNCRVFKTDPDGVIIAHQDGGAKLLFADLTDDSRAMLGYDAKKAADYENERTEQKRKDREELWKYRCEVAKAQAAAYTAEARRLEVITVQNLAGGYGGVGGYGYGWDGFSGFGYGSGYGFGSGFGFDHGFGHGIDKFGCSPLRHGFVTRGRSTFPTPANFGTLNVRGRTFFAPQRCAVPLATPAMGPLTPALGGGGRR